MVPMVQIELAIEATPVVRLVCDEEGEQHRLLDWINSRDGLAELVLRALELADQQPAA